MRAEDADHTGRGTNLVDLVRPTDGGATPRVRLGGTFAIEHGDRTASERDLPGRQLRAAFAYLVLERGRDVSHDELADALWPDGPPATWQPALRGIVSKVRAFLDIAGIDGSGALIGEAGRYRLTPPTDLTVDIEAAEGQVAAAAEALAGDDVERARELASAARSVLSQPLLPGIDAPWLDQRRDELARSHLRALDVLGVCRLRNGEYAEARTAFEAVIRHDALDEAAWRGVMQSHAAEGRTAKALATYEQLRALLAEELGADPSTATQELHTRLLRGDWAPDERNEVPEPAGAVAPVASSGQPFQGLRPFEEADQARFFGREGDVQRLLDMLGRHRFVAVVGPSGSGKSSLVRAGLLPALARGGRPDSDTWHRATVLPGDDPPLALASALARTWPQIDVRQLAARLAEDPAALDDTVSRLLTGQPHGRRLLLLVDQFEEVFTLTRDRERRAAFVTALLDAARSPTGRIAVVVTMRSDFLTPAADHGRLAEAMTDAQFVVGPLGADGLERAIQGPVHQLGARFEDGLVATILTEVAGEPGALPLLQHALLELWERRTPDGLLLRSAYEDVGGVAGALARRAESTYSSLDSEERAIARRILLRLTEPGEETADTRRRAAMAELASIGEDDRVERVIRILTDARLITTSSIEGEKTIEVTHEALIVGWPRLRGWVEDDREGLRLHRRLTEAAHEWHRAGRTDDLAWRGSRLATIEAWSRERPDDLAAVEGDFLRASLELREREVLRQQRLQRGLTIASVAAAVVLAVLALAAVGARRDAETQRQQARSRALAAEATNVLANHPELSLLLGLEAREVSPTLEAEAAIRSAHERNHLRWRHEGGFDAAEVSPDGTVVAATGASAEGGIVELLDAKTGTSLARATLPGTRQADALRFGPDGRMAVVEQNGEVVVFDAQLVEVARLPGAFEVAWSPDGRWLLGANIFQGFWVADATTYEIATQTDRGGLFSQLSSAASGAPRPGGFAPGLMLLSNDFSGDGQQLLVMSVPDGRVVAEFTVESGGGVAAFSPDGNRLAVDLDGRLQVLEVSTWQPVSTLPLRSNLVDLLWLDDDRIAILANTTDVEVRRISDGTVVPLNGLREARALHRVDAGLLGTGTQGAMLWDPQTGAKLKEIVGVEFAGSQVYGLEASGSVVVPADESAVAAYDLTVGGSVANVLSPDTFGRGPFHARFANGNVASVTVDAAGRLQVLDLDAMHVVAEQVAVASDGLAVDDSGTLLAAASPDDMRSVTLYDEQLRPQATWPTIGDGDCSPSEPLCHVSWLAFSPDGRLGVGTRGGWIRVHEPDGTLVREFPPDPVHDGSRMRFAFTADGRRLVRSAFHPVDALAVLDLQDGSSRPLDGHDDRSGHYVVRSVTTGAVAVSDNNGRITIRDPETLEVVQVLEHNAGIRSMDFVGADRLLVAAGETALLWDLRSARSIATFGGTPAELRGALWLGEDRVATFDRAGNVRVQTCRSCAPIDQLVEQARAALRRELTSAERDLYLRQ